MAGRNGIDVLSIVLLVAGFIINSFCGRLLPSYFVVIPAALLAWAVFRIFSRNVTKRREENYKFLNLWNGIKTRFVNWRERRSMSKTYKFFTCPSCKNKLRVPRGKGKIQITCPRCGQRFGGKS